jgi:hypothetical protein
MLSFPFRFVRSRSALASFLLNRSQERERVGHFDLLRSHERKRVVSRPPRLAPARRYARRSLFLGLILASPLFSQGLASSTVDLNYALTGERPPAGTKALAAVADIVTAPVQLPLILWSKARRDREKADEARFQDQIVRIRQNPDYIFQHRLHHTKGNDGLTALIFTLRDPSVPFTDAQLRRLHREMGIWGWRVYTHPACSREFLAEAWQRYCTTEDRYDSVILHAFGENPNVPDEWLEPVARGELKASNPDLKSTAQYVLHQRRSERRARPAATVAPAP